MTTTTCFANQPPDQHCIRGTHRHRRRESDSTTPDRPKRPLRPASASLQDPTFRYNQVTSFDPNNGGQTFLISPLLFTLTIRQLLPLPLPLSSSSFLLTNRFSCSTQRGFPPVQYTYTDTHAPHTRSIMASELPPNVHVSQHPSLQAKISQLRSQSTSSRETNALVHEISLIVACEALSTSLTAIPGPKVCALSSPIRYPSPAN